MTTPLDSEYVAAPRSALAESSPWLFGPAIDVAVFGGSAALGLALVAARRALHLPGELPEWGFVAFVVGVDVAHVYATLFRTYFDRAELRRRPLRYACVPALVYAVGVALHFASSGAFWRVLAYLAVFHFVRQQVGWAALYRARSLTKSRVDKFVEDAALYAGTGYPLLHWHAHLRDARFTWFVDGDFVDCSRAAQALLPLARGLWAAALLLFAVRQLERFAVERRVEFGRVLVVFSTAATWYAGIVATNSDFDFTVTNVLAHGIPYFALVFAYTRAQRDAGRRTFGTEIVAHGLAAFAAVLVTLAFVEEAVWDKLVWHDHAELFGAGVSVGSVLTAFVVPLLAVPQATHYVLDGMVWRRAEAGMDWLRRAPSARPNATAPTASP